MFQLAAGLNRRIGGLLARSCESYAMEHACADKVRQPSSLGSINELLLHGLA
jgi:hypothetical protein